MDVLKDLKGKRRFGSRIIQPTHNNRTVGILMVAYLPHQWDKDFVQCRYVYRSFVHLMAEFSDLR